MSHWQRIKCILLVSLIASTSGNLLNPSKCCSEVKTTGGYNGRFQRSTLKGGEEVLLDESSTSTSYITYDGDVWKLIVLGGWATTYKAYAHADCPETAGSEHFKDLASGEFSDLCCWCLFGLGSNNGSLCDHTWPPCCNNCNLPM